MRNKMLTKLPITAPCRVENRIVQNKTLIFSFCILKSTIIFNLLHWSVQHEIYGRALDQIA